MRLSVRLMSARRTRATRPPGCGWMRLSTRLKHATHWFGLWRRRCSIPKSRSLRPVCCKRRAFAAQDTLIALALDDADGIQARHAPGDVGIVHHVHHRIHVFISLGNLFAYSVLGFSAHQDALLF